MTGLSELPAHYRIPDSIFSRRIDQKNVGDYDLLQDYLLPHNTGIPEHLNRLYELDNYLWHFHRYDMHNSPHSLFLGYSDDESTQGENIADAQTSISIDTIPHTGTILTMVKPI